MAHERIIRLRLREGAAAWEDLRARAQELVAAMKETRALESLRLLQVDDATALLIARSPDATSLERIGREVLDAWLETRVRPLLRDAPSIETGEVLVTLTRADEDTWAAFEALAARERLGYFLRHVTQSRAVWGLYANTWARAPRDDGREALPFWPNLELAARCIDGAWSDCAPRRIDLDAFIDQWLSGMHEDDILAIVCPTPSDPGLPLTAAELSTALHAADG